ncbi:hypothetical protein CQW23_26827 [Capsicum baccatum]|uniref:NB-ARC domain-containing protein n=1 Tax=Capsicum baccatum TaxID=33114 RepID=A0A2G2VPW7_CAPBA|nr:hypothetical protein CQW23_26827 [Capsicum baccatum]
MIEIEGEWASGKTITQVNSEKCKRAEEVGKIEKAVAALSISEKAPFIVLSKVLEEAYVPVGTSVENLAAMIGNVVGNHRISFSDEKLPFEGAMHNKAMHVTVICRDYAINQAPDSSKMNSNMFLELVTLDGSDSVSSPELVSRARNLWIESCQDLTRFLLTNETETLHIWYCKNLEILCVACGTQMASLTIYEGKKLKRLPEGLPFNLQLLEIGYCKKLVNDRKKWRLQRLPSLRELWIEHDGSDEEIVGGENWELPCSIQRLTIHNLKTLSSQLLKSLTSLEYLCTEELPQIQSLLEQQLPSLLSELGLYNHDEFHSLPTEGLQHLTSLRRLDISYCPQLQSLPESVLPSSLSELNIKDCPNLQSLPVKGIPSSLSKLSIRNCPLLEPLVEFDKGEYWPEVAHTSTIEIDDDYL